MKKSQETYLMILVYVGKYVWQQTTTFPISRKINSDFSSLVRSCSVLAQQKWAPMLFF